MAWNNAPFQKLFVGKEKTRKSEIRIISSYWCWDSFRNRSHTVRPTLVVHLFLTSAFFGFSLRFSFRLSLCTTLSLSPSLILISPGVSFVRSSHPLKAKKLMIFHNANFCIVCNFAALPFSNPYNQHSACHSILAPCKLHFHLKTTNYSNYIVTISGITGMDEQKRGDKKTVCGNVHTAVFYHRQ